MDTTEYQSAIKKNRNVPSVATWMDFKGMMLSEVSQREKDKGCMMSLICGILKKYHKLVSIAKKEADSQRRNQCFPVRRGRVEVTNHRVDFKECCTMRGLQLIFCNNCKWSVTFTNCIKIFFLNKGKKPQNNTDTLTTGKQQRAQK